MPRTNEQIDKINEFKKEHGETDFLPYETPAAEGELTEEQKLAKQKEIDDAAAETERLRIEAEGKTGDDADKNKEITPAPTKTELTKEEKEAIAKEFLGVTDLSELVKKSEIPKAEPTKEEIEAELEKREGNKIAYALQQGKFTDKELKAYIADSNNPHDLVFQQYAQSQKALDNTLTDAEIKEEFDEKYGLNQDEDSRKFKRGQEELNVLADTLIRKKHGKIIKFDDEYTSIEKEQLTQKQISEKLVLEAPKYKQTVEEIYTSLKKIPISLGKGEDYEIEMPDDILKSFKERELNTDFAASQIKNGYTKEGKAEAAKLALIYENLPMFIKSVAAKINEKKQAGAKGIPPIEGQQVKEVKKLSAEQQKNLDEFEKVHGKAVAN